jgi:excisionase family DNA binding protein
MNTQVSFDDDELLTLHEAADFLRRSYRTTVRLVVEEGRIDFYRPTQRCILIKKSALVAYLESKKNAEYLN